MLLFLTDIRQPTSSRSLFIRTRRLDAAAGFRLERVRDAGREILFVCRDDVGCFELGALSVSAATCEEAGAAEDGASLRRIKGYGGLLAALRAVDRDFDALAHSGGLCGGDGREAFVLGLLAGLTTLGLVLQTFVVEENLLSGCPDEILSAIDTMYVSILEFHLGVSPLSIGFVCFGVCL
jgi:hypothetical protein